ncbi:MAG: nucleotidyltransferase domain-containing protein [Nanoarchaeota archaeon]
MEFDIKKNGDIENSNKNFSKPDINLSYDFAKHMKKEFGDFIRAIVLFGSAVKENSQEGSDIDVLVVVDDLAVQMTAEVVESYRIITEKILSSVSNRLHVTTLRYLTFWQYARDANPVAVNILRDGLPIIDTGLILPLQHLLAKGEIKPSFESIFTYFSRSTGTLYNAKGHILQGALDLYWAVVDAAQSLLMMYEVVPPSPEHVAALMSSRLVPKGVLKKHHVEVMKEFYTLSRLITHDELKHMSGKEFDEYHRKAYDFVNDVKKELEKMK